MAETTEGGDRRAHARVAVSAPAMLLGPRGAGAAELKDLSQGGARFTGAEAIALPGDSIRIWLPVTDPSEPELHGEVVRAEPVGGMISLAVRFTSARADVLAAKLMAALLTQPPSLERRQHPRVARRVQASYGNLGQLRAILDNVSRGGLSMVTTEPVAIGETLTVWLPDLNGQECLAIEGTVVHATLESLAEPPTHRVGIEFAELPTARIERLKELIGYLAFEKEPPSAPATPARVRKVAVVERTTPRVRDPRGDAR